jgi:TonB family C-terminal domain
MSLFKIIFSALMIASVSTAQAQNMPVKKKTDAYANNTFEEYSVLKSDKSVRHGLFLRTRNEQVLAKGYYNMGQQDSTWEYYSPNLYTPHRLTGKGKYKEGKKAGKWQYYNDEGTLEQVYDHTANKLLFQKGSDPDNNNVTYIGGEYSFRAHTCNIQFPQKAKEDKVDGDVVITFTIDTSGNAVNFRVEKSLRKDCDDAVLRVLKSLPDRWVPATSNGVPFEAEFRYTANMSVFETDPKFNISGR